LGILRKGDARRLRGDVTTQALDVAPSQVRNPQSEIRNTKTPLPPKRQRGGGEKALVDYSELRPFRGNVFSFFSEFP
jgi:hypothetical protein